MLFKRKGAALSLANDFASESAFFDIGRAVSRKGFCERLRVLSRQFLAGFFGFFRIVALIFAALATAIGIFRRLPSRFVPAQGGGLLCPRRRFRSAKGRRRRCLLGGLKGGKAD